MADVDIQCPDCKTITSISEFAEVTSVVCKSCGRKLDCPALNSDPRAGRKLKLRRDVPPEPADDGAPQGYLAGIRPPRRRKRKSGWRISHHIVAWALFIALGTGMWFLRYGGYLSTSQLLVAKQWAPIVVLAFHVLILLKAFQDSVFHGILCLLIPGYSFIYLFFLNDDFYARAVFAGLLVGMAEDSFFAYQDRIITAYEAVTAWLASGG